MTNPYLPRVGPIVGGGLPGLPRRSDTVRGEVTFIVPGSVEWIVPDNVFSIGGVCSAGGGGAVYNGIPNEDVSSGAGGGTSWVNGVKVKPGDVVSIDIGAGGRGASNENSTTAVAGGASRITVNGVVVCEATGGAPGVVGSAATGGTNTVGDGGGSGGDGAFDGSAGKSFATGGAAAGYSGDGGDGVAGNTSTAGNAGSGGGGGSGGFSSANNNAAGSGGVGLNGEGDSGLAGGAGSPASSGTGGSDGQSGGASAGASINFSTVGDPGVFGAGASVAFTDSNPAPSYALSGAQGAVRIIWGTGRAFPSTDVAQS